MKAMFFLMLLNGSAPPTPMGAPFATQQECHAALAQVLSQVDPNKRHPYACVLQMIK